MILYTFEIKGYLMAITSNKEIVEQFFIQAYVNKNYKFVEQFFATDYFDHSAAGARSLQDAIRILKIVHVGFPEIKVKTTQIIEEMDTVVFHGWFSMVHGGLYDKYPATGNTVEFEAIEIFRLEQGKIIESWGYWPMQEIFDQIKGN